MNQTDGPVTAVSAPETDDTTSRTWAARATAIFGVMAMVWTAVIGLTPGNSVRTASIFDAFLNAILEFVLLIAEAMWEMILYFLNALVWLFITTPYPVDNADNPQLWVNPSSVGSLKPVWQDAYNLMYGVEVAGVALVLLVIAFAFIYLSPLLRILPGVTSKGQLDAVLFAFLLILGWFTIGGYIMLFADLLTKIIIGASATGGGAAGAYEQAFNAINPFDTSPTTCSAGAPCPSQNVGADLNVAPGGSIDKSSPAPVVGVIVLLIFIFATKATVLIGLLFFWLGRYISVLMLYVGMPIFIALWAFRGTGIPVLGGIGQKAIRIWFWLVFATLPSALVIRLGGVAVQFTGVLISSTGFPGSGVISGLVVFILVAAIPIVAGFAPLYFLIGSGASGPLAGTMGSFTQFATSKSDFLKRDQKASIAGRAYSRAKPGMVAGGAAAGGAYAYFKNRERREREDPDGRGYGGYSDVPDTIDDPTPTPSVPQPMRASGAYRDSGVTDGLGLPSPTTSAAGTGAGGGALVGSTVYRSPDDTTTVRQGRSRTQKVKDRVNGVMGRGASAIGAFAGMKYNMSKSKQEGDIYYEDEDGNEAVASVSVDDDGNYVANAVKDGKVSRYIYENSDEVVDLFDALDVRENASQEELRAAYKDKMGSLSPESMPEGPARDLAREQYKTLSQMGNIVQNSDELEKYRRLGAEDYQKQSKKQSLLGGPMAVGAGWKLLDDEEKKTDRSKQKESTTTADKKSGSSSRTSSTSRSRSGSGSGASAAGTSGGSSGRSRSSGSTGSSGRRSGTVGGAAAAGAGGSPPDEPPRDSGSPAGDPPQDPPMDDSSPEQPPKRDEKPQRPLGRFRRAAKEAKDAAAFELKNIPQNVRNARSSEEWASTKRKQIRRVDRTGDDVVAGAKKSVADRVRPWASEEQKIGSLTPEEARAEIAALEKEGEKIDEELKEQLELRAKTQDELQEDLAGLRRKVQRGTMDRKAYAKEVKRIEDEFDTAIRRRETTYRDILDSIESREIDRQLQSSSQSIQSDIDAAIDAIAAGEMDRADSTMEAITKELDDMSPPPELKTTVESMKTTIEQARNNAIRDQTEEAEAELTALFRQADKIKTSGLTDEQLENIRSVLDSEMDFFTKEQYNAVAAELDAKVEAGKLTSTTRDAILEELEREAKW